ncbi:MAG TPA: hypothetical protein VG387_09450 [Rhizomicrobium sp.]|jgi:hypothetical protein|nr:hypothetical protein [Rhizomicrobium sp.]
MIAAAVFGLALVLADGGASVLAPKAACQLVSEQSTPTGAYTIAGTYFADGMHGAVLEIPQCDQALIDPAFADDVAARIADYHETFRAKCGGYLMGNYIRGAFTGHFVARDVDLGAPYGHVNEKALVIDRIESKSLDAGSIVCPAKAPDTPPAPRTPR